jgi:hypothetical protein
MFDFRPLAVIRDEVEACYLISDGVTYVVAFKNDGTIVSGAY